MQKLTHWKDPDAGIEGRKMQIFRMASLKLNGHMRFEQTPGEVKSRKHNV